MDEFQDGVTAEPAISNRLLDAWFFYLQKGYYPWFHQQVLSAKELELLVLEHAKAIAHQLPVILESSQAQQRFIFEMNESILLLLLPFL
ncbi:contractile injection system tape measure protein [Niabella hibiscisoli]|uniref:contractile injection system tape measure protein n=1 Tax=Niabella hibiscisoli TaxID=1825928 RepID=UPI00293F3AE0|nr:contractile injection system tape measure protein [Niabella hibiscisoli]